MEATKWKAADFRSCSGSTKFAGEMAAAAPFGDLEHAVRSARDIWFNKVDVKGWLEAFAAHPEIGATSKPVSRWSKEEQSTAMATAGGSTMQELLEWNARYMEKFGFVFLICASGRGSPEILAELKRRFDNRPIVELEKAAEEEMKIIELRLGKLFDSKLRTKPSQTAQIPASKHEDRLGIIEGILWLLLRSLQKNHMKLQVTRSALVLPSPHMSWILRVAFQLLALRCTWRYGRDIRILLHFLREIQEAGYYMALPSQTPMVAVVL